MRVITLLAMCLTLAAPFANAQIPPAQSTIETMDDPGANWIMSTSRGGGYIYDAISGEMQGLISLSPHTPAVQVNHARKEFYAAESYYSRGVHGERIDLLTIYDFENLSPVAEVEIPMKITVLPLRTYIQLMGDGRHVAVFNMTPAASVTIVDVVDRNFVSEISTPGCALIMAVGNNDFLMICGDGTLQLIQLGDDGEESNRVRSDEFFSVEDDPVFDRPVPYNGGWLMVSHEGLVYHATVDGDDIEISDPWSMLSDEDIEEKWRPGGTQMKTVHEDTGLMYILMHQGGQYTHHDPGTEVWVYSLVDQRRIARIELDEEVSHLMVTQEAQPKLIMPGKEQKLHVYDATKMTRDHTIEDAGPGPSLIQDF